VSTTSPGFLIIFAKAIQGGTEITIEHLIAAIGFPERDHLLEKVRAVEQVLAESQLEISPPLTTGTLTTTRVLRPKVPQPFSPETLIGEIANGESATREFKSSLVYDHRRALAVPNTPLLQLRSEEVTHSCLRTIGAFLTCAGGLLLVGVNDGGVCIGIEPDYGLLGHEGGEDRWEQHLRNLIRGRFLEGQSVNDYLEVRFVGVGRATVAVLRVQKRKKLSFLKKGEGFCLYRRQGNTTVEVRMEEIEEFLDLRTSQYHS